MSDVNFTEPVAEGANIIQQITQALGNFFSELSLWISKFTLFETGLLIVGVVITIVILYYYNIAKQQQQSHRRRRL